MPRRRKYVRLKERSVWTSAPLDCITVGAQFWTRTAGGGHIKVQVEQLQAHSVMVSDLLRHQMYRLMYTELLVEHKPSTQP